MMLKRSVKHPRTVVRFHCILLQNSALSCCFNPIFPKNAYPMLLPFADILKICYTVHNAKNVNYGNFR